MARTHAQLRRPHHAPAACASHASPLTRWSFDWHNEPLDYGWGSTRDCSRARLTASRPPRPQLARRHASIPSQLTCPSCPLPSLPLTPLATFHVPPNCHYSQTVCLARGRGARAAGRRARRRPGGCSNRNGNCRRLRLAGQLLPPSGAGRAVRGHSRRHAGVAARGGGRAAAPGAGVCVGGGGRRGDGSVGRAGDARGKAGGAGGFRVKGLGAGRRCSAVDVWALRLPARMQRFRAHSGVRCCGRACARRWGRWTAVWWRWSGVRMASSWWR